MQAAHRLMLSRSMLFSTKYFWQERSRRQARTLYFHDWKNWKSSNEIPIFPAQRGHLSVGYAKIRVSFIPGHTQVQILAFIVVFCALDSTYADLLRRTQRIPNVAASSSSFSHSIHEGSVAWSLSAPLTQAPDAAFAMEIFDLLDHSFHFPERLFPGLRAPLLTGGSLTSYQNSSRRAQKAPCEPGRMHQTTGLRNTNQRRVTRPLPIALGEGRPEARPCQ